MAPINRQVNGLKTGVTNPAADSMLYMIQHAEEVGLLPAQYHEPALTAAWQQMNNDANAKKDAALWQKVDVLIDGCLYENGRLIFTTA